MPISSPLKTTLRAVGSLWFAAVLLLLLMIALGTATVYESAHGTEQAKAAFYQARWFHALLLLLAANVAAAVACRYPFNRRLTPFLLAHGGILTIMAGSLLSSLYHIDGQLLLGKGETHDAFALPGERLTLVAPAGSEANLDLARAIGDRMSPVDLAAAGELSAGLVRATALRYLPDVNWERQVTDDGAEPHLGFDLALTGEAGEARVWVFPGTHENLGGQHADARLVDSAAEWAQILGQTASASKGKIRVTAGNLTREVDLESCTEQAVPLEGTPYTLRLVRYLPHAIVGPDRTIVNASERPANPAVEVEIKGPEGADTRLAFAKFPDFHGRAGEQILKDVKVAFLASPTLTAGVPIEVLGGPEGKLAVRFSWEGTDPRVHELTVGQAVPTPWPGQTFRVVRRFERARITNVAVEQRPLREERQPALLVRVAGPDSTQEVWVQRQQEQRFTAAGEEYHLSYGDEVRPLGFNVTLNQFRIGYYPGGERARSYESDIRLTNPATGHDQSAIVSMNRPTSYGGYTLYQSSYQRSGDDYATVLSVSRDAGRPVVFLGYAALMLGMALLLARRVRADRGDAATTEGRNAA
jgi:hypothetical protein